jgi:hypothetical protein
MEVVPRTASVYALRPGGSGPGTDQHRLCPHPQQMRQELPADAGALLCRRDIGMADKIHLAHVLQSHNPDEAAAILITPEHDAG